MKSDVVNGTLGRTSFDDNCSVGEGLKRTALSSSLRDLSDTGETLPHRRQGQLDFVTTSWDEMGCMILVSVSIATACFSFLLTVRHSLCNSYLFLQKNIPIFHALLTWFFLVGYRETWSQEQCWFSGQYNGSKSLCKTRIRPITFTRFAFSPIGSLSSRASTVCTWCVRVHACVCVLD